MKASDSSNSLSSLQPNAPECFVCLEEDLKDGVEPLVSSKILRTCGCKFMVHPSCWNAWMNGKSDFDCPICRKASLSRIPTLPNPVMYFMNDVVIEVSNEQGGENYRKKFKNAIFLLILLGVAGTFIFLIISYK